MLGIMHMQPRAGVLYGRPDSTIALVHALYSSLLVIVISLYTFEFSSNYV